MCRLLGDYQYICSDKLNSFQQTNYSKEWIIIQDSNFYLLQSVNIKILFYKLDSKFFLSAEGFVHECFLIMIFPKLRQIQSLRKSGRASVRILVKTWNTTTNLGHTTQNQYQEIPYGNVWKNLLGWIFQKSWFLLLFKEVLQITTPPQPSWALSSLIKSQNLLLSAVVLSSAMLSLSAMSTSNDLNV